MEATKTKQLPASRCRSTTSVSAAQEMRVSHAIIQDVSDVLNKSHGGSFGVEHMF